MSWNLSDCFHNPVAPAKQSSSYRVSSTRDGHWSRRVARLSLQFLRRGDGREYGRGTCQNRWYKAYRLMMG